jgi:negative regulator of sigma E activity
MKMTEFRSQQPLNDDDFAAIRRNVMTTIAKRNERRFLPMVMRFALAAAVVIAIGVALVPRHPSNRATQQRSNQATQQPNLATHPPVIPATHLAGNPATGQPGNQTTQQLSNLATQQPAPRPRHHRAPPIELAKQNIRVEFRTSDPDVRIIWIASQTPNTTTGGKS